RVAALAEAIAAEVGVDPQQARRAAELSKADLQSRLVNEFPDLQGIAGRYYAAVEKQPIEVANAIDEGYMPRFAGDAIAPSKLGQVLAIAERLDTLAGGFAAGLKPTGNKDPFALRRNALGLARTLLEGGIELELYAVLDKAYESASFALAATRAEQKLKATSKAQSEGVSVQPGPILESESSTSLDVIEIVEFVMDRLRGYYADQSIPTQQFESVVALKPASLPDFDHRLKAIGEFAKLPEAEALAAANKRIRNILRKVEGEIPSGVDPARFTEPAERDLAAAVDAAIADTDDALKQRDYVAVLGRLARLRPQVDAFFDGVMVNVDDSAVRNNRLALLQRLSDRLGSVAAIEHLST
ncbi:glycine--tRNA ligase subunit beta, partial [Sphingopyxis sp.]|uniref:glycine--tRNA ligase subunit beta n=1 Tax=Sphingopyxis sp. TaxID=1908224 RepID=UPI002FC7C22F